jgi:hypothetical protein
LLRCWLWMLFLCVALASSSCGKYDNVKNITIHGTLSANGELGNVDLVFEAAEVWQRQVKFAEITSGENSFTLDASIDLSKASRIKLTAMKEGFDLSTVSAKIDGESCQLPPLTLAQTESSKLSGSQRTRKPRSQGAVRISRSYESVPVSAETPNELDELRKKNGESR